MKIKETKSRIAFEIFNTLFMICAIVVTFIPLLHVVNASFSDSGALIRNGGRILFAPLEPNIDAYKQAFRNSMIVTGYKNTIFIVTVGTIVNMLMSSVCAYALSRRKLMLNKAMMKFVTFTMFFGGGMIPTYILVNNLGLVGSIWSLIIPGAISTYNMIILRTGFETVPESLIEAAEIDGAGQIRILFTIMIPLAKASIAVVAMYYAITHWNDWFGAAIYLPRNQEKWPLQLVLRQILIMNDTSNVQAGIDEQNTIAESIKYATIVIATLPILCIYPFVQKYFTRGVMIGAVKG